MNNDTPPSDSEGARSTRDAERRDYVPGAVRDDDSVPGGSEDVARLLVESFPPESPDPVVWDRIAASIAQPQTSTLTHDASTHLGVSADPSATPETGDAGVVVMEPRSRAAWPALFAIAAVFLAVIGSVAIINATSNSGSMVVAVYELADPATGAVTATVSADAEGNAVLASVGLAQLSDAETYQLWSVIGDEIVSVGLLGANPDEVALRIEGEPAVLALTVEVAGGVAVSEATPVAVWQASS
ncbi:anti-sigma factor domain-containing protein [Actinomycetota bacterium]|jgi:hypothetical protein